MPGDTPDGWVADLDIPKVEQGQLNSGSDLYYYSGGLHKGGGILRGTGPAKLLAPADCFSAAQTLPVGDAELVRNMVPGTTAWCGVTDQGNLVWLRLLSGGGSEPSGNQWPTLTFELMKWKESS
jgi:hypothetical protein